MTFLPLILFCSSVSLFCLGLFVTTEEGMLLHFLRRPYDRNYEKLEVARQRQLAGFSTPRGEYWRRYILDTLLTPVIGCIICYGSFWTATWYILYFGWYEPQVLVQAMFIVSGMNAILISIYNRL